MPLNSFYLEILLATYDLCVGPKSYATCLTEAFDLLYQQNTASIEDPLGISQNISAANTETQLDQIYGAVKYALDHALRALEAENRGDISEAWRQWNIIFNDQFP